MTKNKIILCSNQSHHSLFQKAVSLCLNISRDIIHLFILAVLGLRCDMGCSLAAVEFLIAMKATLVEHGL